MNIYEYADVINKTIIIERLSNQRRFTALFDECMTEIGECLRRDEGYGHTPDGAVNDYKNKIKNHKIYFERSNGKSQEYSVPDLEDI
jgi:hypothetical protein